MQMKVVTDIEEVHTLLAGRGVAVSDIEHMRWGPFVYFSDPDGNRWSLQPPPPRPQ